MDTIGAMRARTPTFDQTVAKVRSVGTDSLEHFGNGYELEGGYSLQQNPEEIASLVHLLRERAGLLWNRSGVMRPLYLEIGSASGGTLRLLHEMVGFDVLMSMDNHGHHRWLEQEALWQPFDIDSFVGDSHTPEATAWLAEQYAAFPPQSPTFAFVDGDHSYDGVTQDVNMVRPYLRQGSLIILHDTVACEGVERCFRETTSWSRPIANYVGGGYRPLGIGVLEIT